MLIPLRGGCCTSPERNSTDGPSVRRGASNTLPLVHRVEFTIEPFVEGRPGVHVTAPVDALRELGVEVDVGPFGSGCTAPAERSAEVVAAVVAAAFRHGASHVNIDITDIDIDIDIADIGDEGTA